MSVSTRTAQQPLGIGQLGTALVVIALAIVIAAALAFGSMAAKKATVIPAAGLVPGAALDHGSRAEFNSVGAPTKGSGYYRPDGRGGVEFVQTGGSTSISADPGFAPRSETTRSTLRTSISPIRSLSHRT